MPEDEDAPTAVSHTARAASRLAVGCVLEVTGGPDVGKRFVVDGSAPGRTYIGQSPTCEVRLLDRTVSRRHAALELQPDGVRLTDLGSTNGTRVNGLRVHDVVMTGGETVTVGATVMLVQATAPIPIAASDATAFGKTSGASPAMRRLYPIFTRLAATDVPVIIEGETGTGKEVLAESIHDASARAAGPFVVLDCTALAPSLAEATLFGHERGAFTGAVASQRGMFEEAGGGTLFIDEIGDLDIALQAKLLRAIERSEVRRVGGTKWTRVDVRIISATRRDLEREIQAGRFRDDLYFRLAVVRVELPPLRRREGDVALLSRAFWRELGGDPNALDGDFVRRLEEYDWPGNVRELKNALARRYALGELAPLERDAESAPSSQGGNAAGVATGAASEGTLEDLFVRVLSRALSFPAAREALVDEFQRRYVARVLAEHGGNIGKAAAASGIGRRYFQTIRGRLRRAE
jgi:two-component system response regulator HydG